MSSAKTIWLTGLSGAGKSTIANELKKGIFHNYVIVDGDDLRKGICSDLGFSDEDRMQNIDRAAHLCKLLNAQGLNVIACMMSPLESHRTRAKQILEDSIFMVYVACSIEEVRKRDPKGLYKKYDEGLIKGMSGLDSSYEVPVYLDTVVNTEFLTLENCYYIITQSFLRWKDRKQNSLEKSKTNMLYGCDASI
jgi:adenylylsulfate kinase